MTNDEAIRELDALTGEDQENDHFAADNILLSVLRSHGLGDVADAFERQREELGFWYA